MVKKSAGFLDAAAAHTRTRFGHRCTVCTFLATLPDGFRAEVVEAAAMPYMTVSSAAIVAVLKQHGFGGGPSQTCWTRHRRNCDVR